MYIYIIQMMHQNQLNGLIKNLEGANFFSATKKLNPTSIVEDLIKKNNPDVVVEEKIEKLDENISEHQAYKKRKNDSIAIVTEILKEMEDWRKYFISHPKKDDLADSLLQGIAQWSMHSQKNFQNNLVFIHEKYFILHQPSIISRLHNKLQQKN